MPKPRRKVVRRPRRPEESTNPEIQRLLEKRREAQAQAQAQADTLAQKVLSRTDAHISWKERSKKGENSPKRDGAASHHICGDPECEFYSVLYDENFLVPPPNSLYLHKMSSSDEIKESFRRSFSKGFKVQPEDYERFRPRSQVNGKQDESLTDCNGDLETIIPEEVWPIDFWEYIVVLSAPDLTFVLSLCSLTDEFGDKWQVVPAPPSSELLQFAMDSVVKPGSPVLGASTDFYDTDMSIEGTLVPGLQESDLIRPIHAFDVDVSPALSEILGKNF